MIHLTFRTLMLLIAAWVVIALGLAYVFNKILRHMPPVQRCIERFGVPESQENFYD